MKLVLVPTNLDNLDKYIKKGCEGFIFGLKNYSINYLGLTIDEIKFLTDKYKNIEIFVAVNKTIFNHELEDLEQKLIELDKCSIKGVLFYDLGVLSLYKKNNFSYSLGWHQTHMVTNYNTCNYYFDKGVKYGLLASEITCSEMVEIKKKTSMKLFSFVLGYPIMAHSRRRLLTNYYLSQNRKYDDSLKKINEHDKEYIVIDNNNGTCIYEGDIINGTSYINDLKNSGIEYGIVHGFNIEEGLLEKLVLLTREVIDNNSAVALDEIKNLIGNNTGFFDKKTIFKVKKDEK